MIGPMVMPTHTPRKHRPVSIVPNPCPSGLKKNDKSGVEEERESVNVAVVKS